jgi:hypothetical protein
MTVLDREQEDSALSMQIGTKSVRLQRQNGIYGQNRMIVSPSRTSHQKAGRRMPLSTVCVLIRQLGDQFEEAEKT